MKVTLTKIYRKEAIGSKGPYTRLAIQTKEHGLEWLSGFENSETEGWIEGNTVDVEVSIADKINPKTNKPYINFQVSKMEYASKREVETLGLEVAKLSGSVDVLRDIVNELNSQPTVPESNVDDIPF